MFQRGKYIEFVLDFSKDSFEKLCAAILLRSQWQKEKLSEVHVFL